MKINFTKEHYDRMRTLALDMLMSNDVIATKMGGILSIGELLHTTTIGTLNSLRLYLGKQIEDLENKDEWVSGTESQSKLEKLKNHKDLVNLIIGWKRYNMELEETKRMRKALEEQLNTLRESQKTPEDKIKEIEFKLSSLKSVEF